MNVRTLTSYLIAATLTLAISTPASAQVAGWVASRANCINNESFTYKATFIIRWPLPPIPVPQAAPRRTISTHHDRLGAPPHSVESSSGLVNTWRSAAVHWGEGLPTVIGYVTVPRAVVRWTCGWDPLDDKFRCGPEIVIVWVRIPVEITDRWRVDGEHWEDLGAGPYVRYTSVVDCAWLDSFNLLGD